MTSTARYLKRRLVISPREALVAGGPAEGLERTLHDHLGAGRRRIVVDLARVPHLDSAGIRALVRGHTTAERLGASLTIVNANAQVRSLFGVSQLDRVFNFGDSAVLTPARWAEVRVLTWGALLVAALLWLGAVVPLPPEMAQEIPGISIGAPILSNALAAAPVISLAKLLSAALIALLLASIQRRTGIEKPQSRSLDHAKVLLCTAGALMMLIIGNSIARAFGIAGAASIIRFRTPIEDPKEITVLFLLMGLGMLCGIGAFSTAAIGTAFVGVSLLVLDRLGAEKLRAMMVEITAKSPDFPAAEIEMVFALNRIRFERREVTRGEKTVGRYYTTLDPRISLQAVSDQLTGDGATNIKSIVWEPPKKGD